MALTGLILAAVWTAQTVLTPSPVETPFNGTHSSLNWYGTYAVTDVGKRDVPQLTSRERTWLRMIAGVPAYRKRWKHLRFATARSFTRAPLVVFDAGDWYPQFGGAIGFHIIGEPCYDWFDPRENTAVGTSQAACTNPPPPVPGQERFFRMIHSRTLSSDCCRHVTKALRAKYRCVIGRTFATA